MDTPTETFRVMFVCTGNICRSAVAEQVFRAYYAGLPISFSSAGTAALVGSGMPIEAATISLERNGSPEQHAGRQLDKALVEDSDLVIALTREHRSEIVRTLPRANRFTFTLREMAILLESAASDDDFVLKREPGDSLVTVLRKAIPAIAAERAYATHPADANDYDVIDPFRRSQDVYDQMAEEIDDARRRIEQSLRILATK